MIFEKQNPIKEILQFVQDEERKPLDHHNYETTMWSKGYRKAMTTVKEFILNLFKK